MDKMIEKIAMLGVPSLVLIIAISATGYIGAAALTTALAAIGPFGMIGGIMSLGIIAIISEAITKYGVEKVFMGVVKELYKRGETKNSILNKIDNYPISKELKLKLRDRIENLNVDE